MGRLILICLFSWLCMTMLLHDSAFPCPDALVQMPLFGSLGDAPPKASSCKSIVMKKRRPAQGHI